MEKETIGIIVALAPTTALAVVGFVIAVLPVIKCKFDEMVNNLDDLQWLADLAFEFAFIGSAAVSFVFTKMDEQDNMILTGMWFSAWLFFNRMLLRRMKDLQLIEAAEKAKTQRNKLAGLVRSIVKSELEKAAQIRKGSEP